MCFISYKKWVQRGKYPHNKRLPYVIFLFLFLLCQWIDGVLSGGAVGEFFDDEFRNPVYVKDVVHVIELLIAKNTRELQPMHLLLNLGGPTRVSRADMADTVADVRGYDKALVKRVSSLSVSSFVSYLYAFC